MKFQPELTNLMPRWDSKDMAKVLNISVAHATDRVLDDQSRTILAFWLYLDSMTDEQWVDAARAAWYAAREGDRAVPWRAVPWSAVWGAARDYAWDAAVEACSEIMRERGQEFFFLPMFGFASPKEIPPLPADYGVVK